MYMFLTTSEAMYWYTDLEKFALVVAALVHDMDHPGWFTHVGQRVCISAG